MRKHAFYRVVILLLCTLTSSILSAQEKKISGTVKDEKDAPLVGATVAVKNTAVVTTTDANGVFNINVPPNSNVLVVSYVGMVPQEISIKGKATIAVSLNAADNNLIDVVVVGYGKTKKI